MLWTDIKIIFFILPLLITLYLIQRWFPSRISLRNIIILCANYWFYGSFSTTFLVLMIAITLINYIAGSILFKYKTKWICGAAVSLSLLPLIFYKYANFLIVYVLHLGDNYIQGIILPVGISFFTFQALTYTIDIYRNKIHKPANIVDFALFVSFFPTILSGPIEKARNLLAQISSSAPITAEGIVSGFQIFTWGLFKKVVVADCIASYVNSVYSMPFSYSGNSYLFAIILYSIQIYCDFSGYSDMAVGIARSMGFRLSENFRYPYFSTSIRQFWKKWHISLTSWFTEYFYIACGGNRVKKWRWVINISLVFLISGLWHGAAWTFVVWGAIHALLYLLEHMIGLKTEKIGFTRIVFQSVYVFVLVSIAWVFFRASSLENASDILLSIFQPWGGVFIGSSLMSFLFMIVSLLSFLCLEILVYFRVVDLFDMNNCYLWRNQIFTIMLILTISLLGHTGASFVYFQF